MKSKNKRGRRMSQVGEALQRHVSAGGSCDLRTSGRNNFFPRLPGFRCRPTKRRCFRRPEKLAAAEIIKKNVIACNCSCIHCYSPQVDFTTADSVNEPPNHVLRAKFN
ncbi:hypothetical protein CEXT_138511 [Caerostris extrusa]|uniref:Uncharacterized protein n=1 Tax=Caerostris extrusa TaxID=172846 RepID=A0AAV4VNG3_CAEEX|nr:hypothetical protein CEXT_138511 [Caerostris extrusa]